MRALTVLAAILVSPFVTNLSAAEISGQYLEARSCSVYTGPCFANAEMGQAGKEALLAWKVDRGGWNGVSLDGLGVALVVSAQNTLGYDGVFAMTPGKTQSVVLVDEKATQPQRDALIAFVKETAPELAANVVGVEEAPISLTNDHLEGRGVFRAGDVAKIETRGMAKGDCVCANEVIFYEPLIEVENTSPAFANVVSFNGSGLGKTWTSRDERSAFLATFRR